MPFLGLSLRQCWALLSRTFKTSRMSLFSTLSLQQVGWGWARKWEGRSCGRQRGRFRAGNHCSVTSRMYKWLHHCHHLCVGSPLHPSFSFICLLNDVYLSSWVFSPLLFQISPPSHWEWCCWPRRAHSMWVCATCDARGWCLLTHLLLESSHCFKMNTNEHWKM